MPEGIVQTPAGDYEFTRYSCCIHADQGVFYYKTYQNNQISAVCLHHEDLNGSDLIQYELILNQQIAFQN